ncbi:MAG: hypothetical protein ACRDP6_21340 [Actinoallomurus sp.]
MTAGGATVTAVTTGATTGTSATTGTTTVTTTATTTVTATETDDRRLRADSVANGKQQFLASGLTARK